MSEDEWGLERPGSSLGVWRVVLEQKRRVDGVVGFVGGAFWKGKTLCPFGILFRSLFVSFLEGKTVKPTFHL